MPPPSPADPSPCPCGRLDARGRVLGYGACCGPFIDHFESHPAPDAEALMRSRYTAFTLGRWDHVRATWWPHNCPADLADTPGSQWLGLQVRDHRVIDDAHAEVEFVARWRVHGRAVRLHERSRFVHHEGRWWYVAGDDLTAKD